MDISKWQVQKEGRCEENTYKISGLKVHKKDKLKA